MEIPSKKVDILLPAYNVEKYIRQTLDSLISQSFRDFNLFILDDCSNDNTFNIVKSYEKSDSRIKIFRNEENLGVVNSRNKLFELSKSELLAICDADDIYHSTRLEEQINFLKGKDSKIIDVLRPTLRSATDEYIAEKVGSDPVQYDKNQKATFDRISRITNDLAIYLGGNSADVGFDYYLDEIERYQVKSWMDNQLLKRKGSTVGRELSVVSAIYNRAATEHSKYSKLKKEANPFSGLRTKAEERHEIALRKREVTNTSSRAWTRSEYDAFVSRLSIMKPQLRIVSLLSMHTGARLKDICGLMIEDIVLNNDSDSLVQYRHNPNREITKDSIERVVPLFGDVLVALRTYIEELKQADRDEVNLFPNYVGPRGSDNASNTLNQRHLDLINKDPRFKVHGLRDTLQAKFLAANVQNQISGYIIGWRSKTTVGMQESYSQDGYPHAQMLAALTKAHSVEVWGNITKLGVKLI